MYRDTPPPMISVASVPAHRPVKRAANDRTNTRDPYGDTRCWRTLKGNEQSTLLFFVSTVCIQWNKWAMRQACLHTMKQVSNVTSKRRECAWLLADPTGSLSLSLTIRQHTVTGDITRCTLEMSGQGGGNRKAQGRAWDCFCFIFSFLHIALLLLPLLIVVEFWFCWCVCLLEMLKKCWGVA